MDFTTILAQIIQKLGFVADILGPAGEGSNRLHPSRQFWYSSRYCT